MSVLFSVLELVVFGSPSGCKTSYWSLVCPVLLQNAPENPVPGMFCLVAKKCFVLVVAKSASELLFFLFVAKSAYALELAGWS